MHSYRKLDIAAQQLDAALRFYFDERDYFSAITLAGAAEEILGVHLKIRGQPNAFDEDLKSSLRVYRWLFGEEQAPGSMHKTINRAKNGSKHMYGKNDAELYCDPAEEAKSVLDGAVTNYYRLMAHEELPETPLIRKFSHHLVDTNA